MRILAWKYSGSITVLDKRTAYKSDKGYCKVIKAPSEKQLIKLLLKSDKNLYPTPSIYPDHYPEK
jgi:hypothetical protein